MADLNRSFTIYTFLEPGFPIGVFLEPLQARNVGYCNRITPVSSIQ